MPERPNWDTSATSFRMMIRVAGSSRPMPLGSSPASFIKAMAGAVRRSRHEPMPGGSALPVRRSHNMGSKNPAADERKPGMEPFPSLHGRRETIQGRNEMSAAPFEIIPAWRIARLRAALRDAEQRGANPDDEGHDLSPPRPAASLRAGPRTRKAWAETGLQAKDHTQRPQLSAPETGHHLARHPELSLPAWRQGDTAPFGSIRRAHDQAVAACRAAGLAPPRYRTVYVLWHRGVPPADVVAALRDERQHSMG